MVEEDDAEFVHAYDDPDIIAGQGTLGIEMYHDRPHADTVVVPIGGGGLISGISTAIKHLSPGNSRRRRPGRPVPRRSTKVWTRGCR